VLPKATGPIKLRVTSVPPMYPPVASSVRAIASIASTATSGLVVASPRIHHVTAKSATAVRFASMCLVARTFAELCGGTV
jgi:uncharacterized membrane protein YdcZ (DUF606 family)